MWHLHFVYVAFSTVLKLIAVVVPGMMIASSFKDLIHTLEGFSYITLRICLSCMLFSNLCGDISLTLLNTYGWAVVMSLVPMIFGVVTSVLLKGLLPKERQVLLVLGSTFQNGLEVPLSVVSSIKGIKWLDGPAIRICEQYVFVYNLTCALGLWSVGSTMIKFYKDKRLHEVQDALEEKDFHQQNLELMKGDAGITKSEELTLSNKAFSKELGENHEDDHEKNHPHDHSGQRGMLSQSSSINTAPPPSTVSRLHFQRNLSPIDTTAEGFLWSRGSPGSSLCQTPCGETLARLVSNDCLPKVGRSPSETPTVDSAHSLQQNLDWYRPSRRRARPISVKKFNEKIAFGGSVTELHDSEETSTRSKTRRRPKRASAIQSAKLTEWMQTELSDRATPLQLPHDFSGRSSSTCSPSSPFPPSTIPLKSWERETTISITLVSPRNSGEEGKNKIWHKSKNEDCGSIPRHVSFSADHLCWNKSGGIDHNLAFAPTATFHAENVRPVEEQELSVPYSEKRGEGEEPALRGTPSDIQRNRSNRNGEGASQRTSTSVSLWHDKMYGTLRTIDKDGPLSPDFSLHSSLETGPAISNIIMASTEFASTADLEIHLRDRPLKDRVCHIWSLVKTVLQTPPIILSIIGIFVALVPPLRWLSRTPFGSSIVEAARLMGKGCVPLQLLTLGLTISPTNLRTDPDLGILPDPNDTTEKEEDECEIGWPCLQTDRHASFAIIYSVPFKLFWFVRRNWKRLPPDIRLSILCLSIRLLLLPAWSLLLVHYLLQAGLMPSDKLFVFSICIGVSSPSAVNASLVCTMHRYYHRPFAKMIFFMYCFAAITYTFWISVSITYANHMN